MAQALGYVTKTDNGGFQGTLATMSLKKRINIVPNGSKESDAQPDFRVFTEDRIEIGGGWNRTGKVSGNDYISLTFAAPEFGPAKSTPISDEPRDRMTTPSWPSSGTRTTRQNTDPQRHPAPGIFQTCWARSLVTFRKIFVTALKYFRLLCAIFVWLHHV